MVKIRLRRVGAKGQPFYRVVVADSRSPRDGRFIETIGHYNPRTEPSTIVLDEERVYHWLGVGAQPSDSVWELFRERGVWDRWARRQAGESLEALLEEVERSGPRTVEQVARSERAESVPSPEDREGSGPHTADLDLGALGLSTRTANLLAGAGITTREALGAKLAAGEEAVMAIPGLGPKALEEIKEALAGNISDQGQA